MYILAYSDFSEQLNKVFRIQSLELEQAFDAELIVATDLGSDETRNAYSLVFEVISDEPVPQGIYSFKHDKLQEQVLFAVPIGRTDKGWKLEVVVNQQ